MYETIQDECKPWVWTLYLPLLNYKSITNTCHKCWSTYSIGFDLQTGSRAPFWRSRSRLESIVTQTKRILSQDHHCGISLYWIIAFYILSLIAVYGEDKRHLHFGFNSFKIVLTHFWNVIIFVCVFSAQCWHLHKQPYTVTFTHVKTILKSPICL